MAYSAFASLPKTAKPQAHEHTALASVLITLPVDASERLGVQGPLVVALATGTKCLPGSKRAADGSALNDCHAEVLARRAFIRLLYDEAHTAVRAAQGHTSPSLLLVAAHQGGSVPDWRLNLRPGVRIHMFVSHPPCGDAAILGGDHRNAEKLSPDSVKLKGARTGAKPLKRRRQADDDVTSSELPDGGWDIPGSGDVEPYSMPQTTGVVRRKPGKGDPTLSVSCSDKLARWTLLGLQGSLLGSFFDRPVYLNSLIVGVPSSPDSPSEELTSATQEALERSFNDRTQPLLTRLRLPYARSDACTTKTIEVVAVAVPADGVTALGLYAGHEKCAGRRRVPCGTSLVWWAHPSPSWRVSPAKRPVPVGNLEALEHRPMVLVGGTVEALTGLFGCRAGRGRIGNSSVPPDGRSLLCRAALGHRYLELAGLFRGASDDLTPNRPQKTMTYRALKDSADGGAYKDAWQHLKSSPSPVEGWILKPTRESEFVVEL